jgi:electron transfer flavoprotein alpha subunit
MKRGVWVFIECTKGIPKRISLEVAGEGRRIADQLGTALTTIVVGPPPNRLESLIGIADRILIIEGDELARYLLDGYSLVLCNLVNENKPIIFLFGETHIGRELAATIACKMKTVSMTNCVRFDVDKTGQLLPTRPLLGGKIFSQLVVEKKPQIATVRPRVFDLGKAAKNRETKIDHVRASISSKEIRTNIIEFLPNRESKRPDLEEAEIIVSVGRGLKDARNFGIIEELADLLGASIGATRAVVDLGWISRSQLIGQTGKTVQPKIYVACGISGAIQHVAAVKDAELIIAINKDRNAPIFQSADFGIVGDLFEVIAELMRMIRETREKLS